LKSCMRQLPEQLQWRKSMPKFTFISEDLDLNGFKSGSKLTKDFSCEYLDDVISEFEMFLRGAGYHFEGTLDIVENTKPNSRITPEKFSKETDMTYPTDHYMNIK